MELPHVTAILAECFGRPQLFGSEADMQFWLERGRMIHMATAMFDSGTGLKWASLDLRIERHVAAWRKFREEVGGDVRASELRVESADGYQGTLDRVMWGTALWPKWLVLDIKTTAWSPIVRLQLSAYAKAWRECCAPWGREVKTCDVARAAVALRSDGRWRAEVFGDTMADEAGWRACLTGDRGGIAWWKQRRGIA